MDRLTPTQENQDNLKVSDCLESTNQQTNWPTDLVLDPSLCYVTFESLYDIVKKVHEEGLKHVCRDILNKKLQTMHCNILVNQT